MSFRLTAPYAFDEQRDIWRRPDYLGIPYSDGEEVEKRLLATIEQTTDLSVLSTDLRSRCNDWVTTYHLSGTRANIMRPMEPSLKGDILEIGAGCGAITRYLGECGGQVLALEGSLQRAQIARSRTRELGNVTVVADNFETFETEHRFDVITLIGVLEYAGQFVSGEDPALTMLRKVKGLLKTTGHLVIAIENQFGLKYFAGADEDHVGKRMFGLEDRYRERGVRTYGRRELERLLQSAGYGSTQFQGAFPDYKLPCTIISEPGFDHPQFDAGSIAAQTTKRDPQLPYLLNFAPDRVWPGLVKNGLALDMANSFLVVAGNQPSPAVEGKLAWHFSAERNAAFCKQTVFSAPVDGGIQVDYARLRPTANQVETIGVMTNDISHADPFFEGPALVDEFMDIIAADDWQQSQVASFFQRYLTFVACQAGLPTQPSPDLSTEISGSLLDCIPQNIIRTPDGGLHSIDAEWRTELPLTLGFLLFRTVLSAVYAVHRIGRCADRSVDSPSDLIRAVFEAVGQPLSDAQLDQYAALESRLQTDIIGLPRDASKTLGYLREHRIAHLDLATYLYEKVAMLERDAAHHLAAAEERMKVIEDRDRAIHEILNSTSWKMGKPLRFFKKLISGGRG